MADNTTITPGTGLTVATDDVAGVHYQRVKLDLGADGLANPVSAAVDTAAGATDPVFVAGVVRDDALAALTPVDGDYTALRVDGLGTLWTRTPPSTASTRRPSSSRLPSGSRRAPVASARSSSWTRISSPPLASSGCSAPR